MNVEPYRPLPRGRFWGRVKKELAADVTRTAVTFAAAGIVAWLVRIELLEGVGPTLQAGLVGAVFIVTLALVHWHRGPLIHEREARAHAENAISERDRALRDLHEKMSHQTVLVTGIDLDSGEDDGTSEVVLEVLNAGDLVAKDVNVTVLVSNEDSTERGSHPAKIPPRARVQVREPLRGTSMTAGTRVEGVVVHEENEEPYCYLYAPRQEGEPHFRRCEDDRPKHFTVHLHATAYGIADSSADLLVGEARFGDSAEGHLRDRQE